MADSVIVRILEDQGKVTLSVEDDGIGFDSYTNRTGLGLKSMLERANSIAGELTIHSEAGRGTRITISVEVHKE